jgi:hypothetical protein
MSSKVSYSLERGDAVTIGGLAFPYRDRAHAEGGNSQSLEQWNQLATFWRDFSVDSGSAHEGHPEAN